MAEHETHNEKYLYVLGPAHTVKFLGDMTLLACTVGGYWQFAEGAGQSVAPAARTTAHV